MNKKVISSILAGLISINSHGALIAKSESNSPTTSIHYSQEDKYYYDIAKDYFGIEDPYKMYKFSRDGSTIVSVNIDNEIKDIFANKKSTSNTNVEFFDFFTDEKIFESRNNYKNSYNYFDEGTEVEYIVRTDFFSFYQQSANGKLFDNLDETAEYSAIDLVRAMLEMRSNIDYWYAKDKEISLDNFEYKNIVPSTNDDKLIETIKFQMLVRIGDQSRDDPISFIDKIIFLNVDYVYFEGSKVEEIFGGKEIKVEIKKNGNWEIDKKDKSDYLEDKNKGITFLGTDMFGFYLQKYTRPLRECIEVVNGIEYYNVGKLRKLYENFPEEVRYDYTTGPFKQPASKEIESEHEKGYLYPIDKPKIKELTKES